MIQSARGLGLLLETAQAVFVRRDRSVQDLDRDVPLQPVVPGPVHLSHSSRTERREDLVRPEASPGCESHRNRRSLRLEGARGRQLEPLKQCPESRIRAKGIEPGLPRVAKEALSL